MLVGLRICLSLWIKFRNDNLVHGNKCRKIRNFALFSERFTHVARPRRHVMCIRCVGVAGGSCKVIIFGAIKAWEKHHIASSSKDLSTEKLSTTHHQFSSDT